MFPAESFQSRLRKIARVLRAHRIRFHFTGGLTSIAYSEPRMTQDVDIVIDAAAARNAVDEFLDELKSAGLLFDDTAVRRSLTDGALFQLLDTAESLKVDMYPRELIAGERPLQRWRAHL